MDKRKLLALGGCCALYAVASGALFQVMGNPILLVLVWNLILATVPLVFACLSCALAPRSRLLSGLFFLLWLVFFPNAPYMMTDLIHLNQTDFYSPRLPLYYSTDWQAWAKLVQIGLGAFLGLLLGTLSLSVALRRFRPGGVRSLWLVLLSLLGGFGIYIGRFLRFNSWDVLNPIALLRRVLASLNGFSLVYTLLMAGMIAFAYGAFRLFAALSREEEC